MDEGNLFRKAKRDNIPFIVCQICNISRRVEGLAAARSLGGSDDALCRHSLPPRTLRYVAPYDFIKTLYFIVAVNDYITTSLFGRSKPLPYEVRVTEGNTSYAKRTSCRQALHGTKSCFVSTKSIVLPYGLIYIYQKLWDDGLTLF